ncbi:MAG: hypothetical protein KAT90_12660 [Gammaproteobacteria bacterium]|nr:hypothetical protein [Gammaproteobacteria bacterium]
MEAINRSTGTLAVDTTNITKGAAIAAGISITAAAADVTVTLYDELTATGTVVAKYILDIDVEGLSTHVPLPNIKCSVGLTAVVAGAGAEVQVHYR